MSRRHSWVSAICKFLFVEQRLQFHIVLPLMSRKPLFVVILFLKRISQKAQILQYIHLDLNYKYIEKQKQKTQNKSAEHSFFFSLVFLYRKNRLCLKIHTISSMFLCFFFLNIFPCHQSNISQCFGLSTHFPANNKRLEKLSCPLCPSRSSCYQNERKREVV